MWSTLEGPSCPCEIICCRKLQFLRASNGRLIGTFVWFMLLNTQTSSKKSVAKLNCSLIKLTALLTFSWARLKDFWTRLAKIPAPAWRFGPALFSAIVRLSRELLCNHSDPRRVCFLSRKCLACASLKAGGGATMQETRRGALRQTGDQRNWSHIIIIIMFRLVNGITESQPKRCCETEICSSGGSRPLTLTWNSCAEIALLRWRVPDSAAWRQQVRRD